MKWIVLAGLIIFVNLESRGQDYVVRNIGDTLRGKVKFQTYDRLDRVQVTNQKEKTTLTARDVRTIFSGGKFYQPLQFENMIRFMEIERGGYLSLLVVREGIQVSTGGKYLVKRDGSMMEVPNLTFKKNMVEFLSDYPEVAEKIKSGEYTKKDLLKIVDEYNAIINHTTRAINSNSQMVKKADEKAEPLQKLRSSVQAIDSLSSRQDALDLIDDMIAKVKANQNIPKYMVDGLQKALEGVEPVKEDLEAALNSLK